MLYARRLVDPEGGRVDSGNDDRDASLPDRVGGYVSAVVEGKRGVILDNTPLVSDF